MMKCDASSCDNWKIFLAAVSIECSVVFSSSGDLVNMIMCVDAKLT